MSTTLAAPSWTTPTGSAFAENNAIRTVIDLHATGEEKFYRVEIMKL